MNTEPADRYLCSNLVSIQLPASGGGDREVDGNLEEINASGAYVNVEEPIETKLPLRMVCADSHGKHEFGGVVTGSSRDPVAGYYLEMEFNPGTRWSPEIFRPNHLIRASAVLGLSSEEPPSRAACCDRGVCPKEVLSQLLEPQTPLTDRVRAIAQDVADLCGTLTDREAAKCFGTLFGAGPEGRLFAEFRKSYTRERRRSSRPHHGTLRTQFNGLMRLANAIAPEMVRSKGCTELNAGLTSIRLPEK
ncbi:hypothetical protein [uncultured Paludibaculum sp.]|uniref:hypothetical protein n=1 Tax=uncultured Paludibaculum sp. TaxID=1765020 RepID=UPI002AAAC1D1|nr:hypothetical protein [uncultured Paludibaculum sp.]